MSMWNNLLVLHCAARFKGWTVLIMCNFCFVHKKFVTLTLLHYLFISIFQMQLFCTHVKTYRLTNDDWLLQTVEQFQKLTVYILFLYIYT